MHDTAFRSDMPQILDAAATGVVVGKLHRAYGHNGTLSSKQPLLDCRWRLAHLLRDGREFVSEEAVAGDDLLEELGLFGVGCKGGFEDSEEF